MIHVSSANSLPTTTKKRRISVAKNKQSAQKVNSNSNQLVKKVSHKQNKQKIQVMQTAIDQEQYKSNTKKIYSLNDKAFPQALDQYKYKQANRILEEIKQIINATNYGPNKKYLYHHLSIYHCNKAYVLHQLDDKQGSSKQMEQSIRNFEYSQGYILSRQENLSHSNELIKFNLQYFTTLSNVNKHLEAIVSAQKCIQKLSQSFRILDAMCTENLGYSDTPDTIATQGESRVKSQKVNFKRVVIKQAQKLLKQIDISSPHKLMTQNKQKFQQKLKNMYFWKNNMENNMKLAQKELNQKGKQTSNRNLLGVQKTSNFTQQFSLGELMSLNIKKMKQKLNTDQYFLLSSPKIIQMVLFASVCYFTIATQTRFKQVQSDLSTLKITQKYQKLNKDQIIFRCKVLHLKAIQLAAKYLPQSNSYFKHILNSFNTNYKFMLDEINEQSQSSMKSYNKSLQKYRKQIQAQQQGLNEEYGMCNVHNQNTLHASSKTQKRQMTEKMQKLERSVHQNTQIIKKRVVSKDKQSLTKRKTSVSKK